MTKLGFQLYSARNYPPLSSVLSTVAKAGYSEVEGYGALYGELDDAGLSAFRADLDTNGLSMPTGHFSVEMLESDPNQALKIAKVLGVKNVYAPYLMPDQRPTDAAGWVAFGKRLHEAGKRVKGEGYDFGWHNHDFEFFKLEDGSYPIDRIFEGGPELSWEADIAWVVRGGGDPFEWIEKLGPRITSVHVKDIAPEGQNADEGGWADVGFGVVPWAKLMPVLRATNAQHYIVEHDNPSDLDRVVTRSIASFKTY